jgi:hypothetical protein
MKYTGEPIFSHLFFTILLPQVSAIALFLYLLLSNTPLAYLYFLTFRFDIVLNNSAGAPPSRSRLPAAIPPSTFMHWVSFRYHVVMLNSRETNNRQMGCFASENRAKKKQPPLLSPPKTAIPPLLPIRSITRGPRRYPAPPLRCTWPAGPPPPAARAARLQ